MFKLEKRGHKIFEIQNFDLEAMYVKSLEEEFVGNAKYGIFFSTKGRRSVGSELANGDFDGDQYWVSQSSKVSIFILVIRLHLVCI